MIIFWGAAAVMFIIVEAVTVSLTTVWFALGSLAALVAALLGAKLWLQIAWFIVISVVTMILTRPLVKKYINGRKYPTNADRLIGQTARVSERIDNITATGTVPVDGKVWTARSSSGEAIEAGTLVIIEDIQGVKLIVSPKGE